MSDDNSAKALIADVDTVEATSPAVKQHDAPISSPEPAADVPQSIQEVEGAIADLAQSEREADSTAAVDTAEPTFAAGEDGPAEPLETTETEAAAADITAEDSIKATAVAEAVKEDTPVAAAKASIADAPVPASEEAIAPGKAEEGGASGKAEEDTASGKAGEDAASGKANEAVTSGKTKEYIKPTVADEPTVEAAVLDSVAAGEPVAPQVEEAKELRPEVKQAASPVKGSPKKHATGSSAPVATSGKAGAEGLKLPASASDTKQYLEGSVIPVLRQGLRELVRVRPSDPLVFMSDYFKKASQNKN